MFYNDIAWAGQPPIFPFLYRDLNRYLTLMVDSKYHYVWRTKIPAAGAQSSAATIPKTNSIYSALLI